MYFPEDLKTLSPVRPRSVIIPAISLMLLPVLAALFLLVSTGGGITSGESLEFLLPWVLGLGILMAIPMIVLYRRGHFWIADPLVLATLTYFFPAFVIGGLFYSIGWSAPLFQSLILDPTNDLPLTVIVVALGYGGLATGYFIPLSGKIGLKIRSYLPEADYPTWSYFFPGVLLIALGIVVLILTFSLGILGYQISDTVNAYDGLLYMTTMYWVMASFLLWLLIFRQTEHPPYVVPVVLALIITSVARVLVSGGRGAIIQIATLILLAFVLSGRRFRLRESAIAGVMLSVALLVGMVYGTTFRSVKGTERAVGAEQYIESIVDTFAALEGRDLGETISFGINSLIERVDILSPLAVVVSNHAYLKPFEEQYGINDNIWVDMTTFFVPRIFWPEKPSASDPRSYSDLYFNFAESSFAITPMGDLIRNFGIPGVFLGMFVIGVLIRVIYTALIQREKPVIWRLVLYFMLISTISYEAFYGTMIPTMVKIGFLTVIGLIFTVYLAGTVTKSFPSAETSA